jgi:Spy/CpxP family protein refolding chaperone
MIRNRKREETHLLAHSKAALIALALLLSCSTVFAQGDPTGPPSDSSGAPGGMRQRGSMRQDGPGRDGDGWGRGRDGGNWGRGRDGFGRDGREGMRGRGMDGREFGLSRMLNNPDIREKLGVTPEQAARIRQQASDFRKTEIRGRADMQVKRLDLRDLLAADNPDRAAIDAKLQEISSARLALDKSAIDYRLNSRDALTPAQRDKLRQLMQDRRQQGGGAGARAPRGPRPGAQRNSGTPPAPSAPTPPGQ